MMSARFHAAAMYPGAISWEPSAANENARVTPSAGGAGLPAPAPALDRHDLHLVPEIGRAFGEPLDHPLHAARTAASSTSRGGGCAWLGEPRVVRAALWVYSRVAPATSLDIPIAVNLRNRLRPTIAYNGVCRRTNCIKGVS